MMFSWPNSSKMEEWTVTSTRLLSQNQTDKYLMVLTRSPCPFWIHLWLINSRIPFHQVLLSLTSNVRNNLTVFPISVFIAPVGYKVPPGYKGHPLPYDPTSVEALNQNRVSVISTTSGNDLEDVVKAKNPFLSTRSKTPKRASSTTTRPVAEESNVESDTRAQTAFESRDPSRVVLDKLKLARNRPSLATFFNNRTKSGNIQGLDDDEIEGERKTRKRVLTKVVRKPFNPDTTTPSGVTNDLKSTVVRLVNILPEDGPVENVSGTKQVRKPTN
jgi:hypothetical protein